MTLLESRQVCFRHSQVISYIGSCPSFYPHGKWSSFSCFWWDYFVKSFSVSSSCWFHKVFNTTRPNIESLWTSWVNFFPIILISILKSLTTIVYFLNPLIVGIQLPSPILTGLPIWMIVNSWGDVVATWVIIYPNNLFPSCWHFHQGSNISSILLFEIRTRVDSYTLSFQGWC